MIFLAVDGALGGILGVADPIKRNAQQALQALRDDGLRIVMLTGDNRATAQAVAQQLAIDDIEAEVLPDQKGAVVDKLRREGRVVAMAGDGVYDAPALAAADVGIAMGTGTDVAIESAGITLLKGDLAGLVRARHLSRAIMNNITAKSVLRVRLQRRLFRSQPVFFPPLRHPAVADHWRRGDGAFVGERDRERLAAALGQVLNVQDGLAPAPAHAARISTGARAGFTGAPFVAARGHAPHSK